MKSASTSAEKWQSRAGAASADYAEGAEKTDKDQSTKAIAAKEIYKAALNESFARDAYAKGLQKSGKAGWLRGIQQKGSQNFATGIMTENARSKYVTNSGRFDSARNAAANLPRQAKGSAANLNRVTAVVNALRAVKIGK